MLNPSTADAEKFDPTVRRCFGYARDWGFGRMEVVNLFAFRSTYPDQLLKIDDPVGPDNNAVIIRAVNDSDLVIVAWGIYGRLRQRNRDVLGLISGIKDLYCLGASKSGEPLHPLHQPKRLRPVLYSGRHEVQN